MNHDFSDQLAIVTGAARGLALSLTKKLSAAGATVVAWDLDGDELEGAVAGLDRVHPVQVDVTDASAVRRSTADVAASKGTPTMLANCAGIVGETNIKSHEVGLEDFDRVMNVNLRGCLIPFQAVVPHMLEADYGRVLHVASISGKEGNAGMLAYSTSKAAVIGMTKVQGKEYADTGVRVNAIAPAVIYTDMVAQMPEEQVRYMTDKIPMARCGTMDEFAEAACYILSPENSFTTGFTFDLSGGRATY